MLSGNCQNLKTLFALETLEDIYISQMFSLTFFKDYRLIKSRLHQTGQ